MQRLDGVFGIEMAYIAAWHQAPVRQGRDLLASSLADHLAVRRAPGKLEVPRRFGICNGRIYYGYEARAICPAVKRCKALNHGINCTHL